MSRFFLHPLFASFFVVVVLCGPSGAADDPLPALGDEYQREIHAVLKSFCLDCHSTADKQGELDLERFATLAAVRHDPRAWQKVAEMLDNGEMPPKDAEQPSPDQRRKLRDWVARYLDAEARAGAGDPGRVVLRRLNNVEFTNTVRDLTGVPLSPAREFPVDGATGEGFTNSGESLVMSPALLTKYLDAAKEIASHAVLLPDGFRFSSATNQGDWIEERLSGVRAIYRQYCDADGRLALEPYLAALIENRQALIDGKTTTIELAARKQLSPRYLANLRLLLLPPFGEQSSATAADYAGSILDQLRTRLASAKPEEAAALAGTIRSWQSALWKTNTVGHYKPRNEPIDPVVAAQDLRLKLPAPGVAPEVVISLLTDDAGDGATGDAVVWEDARFEAPGRPPSALRDVRAQSEYLLAQRQQILAATRQYLTVASTDEAKAENLDVAALAARHQLNADALGGWLDYLGVAPQGPVVISDRFTPRLERVGGYEFVRGWGTNETPQLIANSSDETVHVPGLMKPHTVAVHPSPTRQTAVGWQSPVQTTLDVSAQVTRAHPECGNGVTWSLEVRRGTTRARLSTGKVDSPIDISVGPVKGVKVRPGDVISLLVGPRDGNHACDLTQVELRLVTTEGKPREWLLSRDVSSDVAAGNPHSDSFGNKDVWHFYTENVTNDPQGTPTIPAGSTLARWRDEKDPAVREQLAQAVERLLNGPAPAAGDEPDSLLYRQAISLTGPLLNHIAVAARKKTLADLGLDPGSLAGDRSPWGIDPARFGKRADGTPLGPNTLAVSAPAALVIRVPADLVADCEFVARGVLDSEQGKDGSAQLRVVVGAAEADKGLVAGVPILVAEASPARQRIVASLAEVRRWFPPTFCFPQIVPIDEVVTIEQYHRGDEALGRLVVSDQQRAELDRLWEELRFISRDALRVEESYVQFMEYTTQDSNPELFKHLAKPITERGKQFRQEMLDAEQKQFAQLPDFAERAFRRPLLPNERNELASLYRTLCEEELSHDDALRLVLAKIFVSPAFLYRAEHVAEGQEAAPVSDWELASRLSYFLWATMPDDALRSAAAAGHLHEPDVLVAQAHRMLADPRTRTLAVEFACQWLDVREFDKLDEKSESHFPTFLAVRSDVYEESIRFFTDLFQRDGSVLEMLDADHTFVNEALAAHYGIPGVTGAEWRRVDGVRQYGRGGILGLGTTLAKNAGASRTSPILRGNWVVETVLGEKLPKPPQGVPLLPEDETATDGLTVRQLVEKHTSVAACASCHRKIDPFGFALEGFDAIGRKRDKDLAERPIDVATMLADGTQLTGLDGLRTYLVTQRKDQFLRVFCRKLLGYALGRGLQLSDDPLVAEMAQNLAANDYRFSAALDTLLRSKQFRYHRGSVEQAE